MANLTLFVPGFFAELLTGAHDTGHWPALETLLARASLRPETISLENRLCTQFGFTLADDCTPPLADITASVDLPDRAPAQGFIRVDPVHLKADPGHLVLFDARSLDLAADEADRYISLLNEGLAIHGVILVRGAASSRWYARLDAGADLQSFSPRAISGCPADLHLPAGSRASFLRRVMNDAQMLLHECPDNQAREQRGLPVVNSVWLWGAGALPEPLGTAPDLVVTNDVLSGGLARRRGCRWRNECTDAATLLPAIDPSDEVLVVFGAPSGVVGEPGPVTVDELEARWARPLLSALRGGRVRRVSVVTDGATFTVDRWSVWQLWRRASRLDVVKRRLRGA